LRARGAATAAQSERTFSQRLAEVALVVVCLAAFFGAATVLHLSQSRIGHQLATDVIA